jgi:CRP-like cAMP-binding protein
MKALHQIIAEHPFFAGLSHEYCDLIAGCGEMAVYEPGQFLFRTGAEAVHFFLIRHGRVALELTAPGRDPFLFETLSDGEVVGWSWLFEPHVSPFDARALERTRLFRFDGRCLRGKCEEDPRLGFELMRRFARVLVQGFADTRLQLIDVYGKRR